MKISISSIIPGKLYRIKQSKSFYKITTNYVHISNDIPVVKGEIVMICKIYPEAEYNLMKCIILYNNNLLWTFLYDESRLNDVFEEIE